MGNWGLVVSWMFLALPAAQPAHAAPARSSLTSRDAARAILQSFAACSSARWELRSWKKLGDEVEESAAHGAWSRGRGVLLELTAGRSDCWASSFSTTPSMRRLSVRCGGAPWFRPESSRGPKRSWAG